MYGYLYVADSRRPILVARELLDGNPSNNFLTRALTFNPNACSRRPPYRLAGHT